MSPYNPSDEEVEDEVQKLKAMLMILRSDQVRYGDLQDSLFEGMYKGRDEFSLTVVEAYDLLQRISNDAFQHHQGFGNKTRQRYFFKKNRCVGNISFAQKGTKEEAVPGNDGILHPNIKCHNCHQFGH